MKPETAPLVGVNDTACLNPANDATIGLIRAPEGLRLRDLSAVSMDLEWKAASAAARSAVDWFYLHLGGQSIAGRTAKLKDAIGAVLNDLLNAAENTPFRPCFRSMRTKDFTGGPVGYRSAKAVIDLFEGKGLVHLAGGNFNREGRASYGTTTRIWPTTALLDRLAEFGITPSNRRDHFMKGEGLGTATRPILLSTSSAWRGKRRVEGKPLPVDATDPTVINYAAQVERFNVFIAKQVIEGAGEVVFFRKFNCGDQAGHAYRKGGRLWVVGGGYQMMPKKWKPSHPEGTKLRSSILINGEPTTEIDIGSSHLTIFQAKLGVEFDPQADLYDIPGMQREVVKAYVNLTLSKPRLPKQWPADMRSDFLDRYGYEIDRDHSISCVMDACLELHPILRQRKSTQLDWSDLQFIESQAILGAMDSLNQDFGIACLPIHDSLIIPLSHKDRAIELLKESFKYHVGIIPRVN